MKTLRHGPWLLLLVLWASAFSLACRLDDGSRPPRPAGWGAAVLGSLRGGLSRHLYFEADRYFHGGLEHTRDRAFEDGLQRLRQTLTPAQHVHLQGRDVAEILPWLRAAAALDPTQVEPFLVAAYWVNQHGRQPELATRIYREALRHNPGDYRIYQDWAAASLRARDIPRTLNLLTAALQAWRSRPDWARDEQARRDYLALLERRGVLALHLNQAEVAREHFNAILALAPGRASARKHLDAIERGDTASYRSLAWLDELQADDAPPFHDQAGCAREAGSH